MVIVRMMNIIIKPGYGVFQEDEDEEDDDEYYEFDSDQKKRRIGRSDAIACTYHVVCQYYQVKGWEHNN